MCKKKRTASVKFTIIQEIEAGRIDVKAAAPKLGMTKTTLAKWRHYYRLFGYEGLEVRSQGEVEDYIHFYNYERLQAKLNGLSPMEFRTKAA
ncbi:transposase-like protein [Paenibacillus castaneae]|uniref:IS3 family transposase n=1 Tax=Paenibacillus castaneae TaxID=474957 RepID=UPI000C9B6D9B|nr:IS3 family transposase [Paenibacillus castaneae]NIK79023.1 transposase-like protein [Paenibacillus castaneae]